MKNLLLSLMFFFPASGAMAQDKEKPTPEKTQPIEERIRQLIRELGADSYEAREKAQAALEKIGKPALEALRKALKAADLEVSSRAEELIEKITGEKKPEPKKEAPDTPSEPDIPFSPDDLDMEGMLDKLKDFEGLSPNLKKTLDSFRKILEGTKENETPGLPDLGGLEDLLKGFLDRGQPEPELKPAPSPQTKTAIENQLGLEVKPIDDVLRSHLGINEGLVVKRVNPNGHAFKQGLRQHDILILISTESPKAKGVKPDGIAKLEHLKVKASVKIIRKGKQQVIEVAPLPSKVAPSKESGKKRDF